MNLKYIIKKILKESFLKEDEVPTTLFQGLRKYYTGKISAHDLEKFDDSIKSVRLGSDNSGKSKAVITFDLKDDDKLLIDFLDLSQDDGWFAKVILDNYSSYDFMDGYQVEDDFVNGYIIFNDLNQENKDKIEKILFLITGKEVFVNNEQQDDMESAKILLNMFPKEIDNILTEYRWTKEEEMRQTAKEDIEQELNEFLSSFGFKITRKFDYISTTVGNLVSLFADTAQMDLNFEELFKLVISSKDYWKLGGWYENYYEFQNRENFDEDGFNRGVERELDKILEKLEYVDDDIIEFRDVFRKITSKFKVGEFYNLPKDENYSFSLMGFNPENLKIKILAKNKRSWKKIPLELSIDSFNRLLYQPELFDLSNLIPESIEENFDPIYFLKKKLKKEREKADAGGLESVSKYGDDFQRIVNLIFKYTIKEYPVEHLKGLRVYSVWPVQSLVDVRWDVVLIPLFPDWFNYEKNEKTIQDLINFEKGFKNIADYMGLNTEPPIAKLKSKKGDDNDEKGKNIISFNIKIKKFETF